MYHRENSLLISTRAQYVMTGAKASIEGFFAVFPTPILLKIEKEPTREGLIKLH